MRRWALALLLLTMGCGSSGETVGDLPKTEATADLQADACAGAKVLRFVQNAALADAYSTLELQVQYMAGDCPVADATLACKVEGQGGAVDNASVTTQADGTAKLVASWSRCGKGAFSVECCDPADHAVACAKTEVPVQCEADSVLSVLVKAYTGGHPKVDKAEVRLVRLAGGEVGCADLDPAKLPTATISSTIALPGTATFSDLPNLYGDKEQKWRALVLGSMGGGPSLALGCADFTVHCCKETVVEVTLDRDIKAAGRKDWQVTMTVDMATFIPDGLKSAVKDLGAFIADPARGVLAMSCMAQGDQGLFEICVESFKDISHPWTSDLAPIGSDLLPAIQKRVSALLKTACPSGWGQCGAAWWFADDLTNALLAMRPVASWRFDKLGVEGVEGPWHGEEAFERLTITWPDPAAGQPAGPPAGTREDVSVAMSYEPVQVEVERLGLWTTNIKPHTTPLRWGDLVLQAVEKGLLPHLFGDGGGLPPVDSFEAMIGAMMAGGRACLNDGSCCQQFAASVHKGTPPEVPGLTEKALETQCNVLKTKVAAMLRESLLAAGDGAVLKVESYDACAVGDSDGDMVLDWFGSAAAPCTLEVTATLAGEPWKSSKAALFAVPKDAH